MHTKRLRQGSGRVVASSWQTDRGQLNHNWLQNGVLVGLNHAQAIAAGSVRTPYIRQALIEDVFRWQERREDLPSLLDRFENEMSPKVFFTQLPLSRCSDETKGWLIPLIHELWLKREKVLDKMGVAKKAYEMAEQVYTKVHAELGKLPAAPTMEDLRPFERLLRDFTSACETLSRSISALPHEIRCA